MKKYLNTFKGDTVAVKGRRFGFIIFALLYALFVAMFFASAKTFDNQFVALIVDVVIGFSIALVADLTVGIGRKSPLIKEEPLISLLDSYQNAGMFHPFTCDRHAKECEVNQTPRDFSKDGVLIPTEDGWICPCGKYKQPFIRK